ncbi:MAG TPA: DUF202 domain-containing protein [Natronosporangium sp.]
MSQDPDRRSPVTRDTGRLPVTRDPGRQPERTRLAWRRTMLAISAVTVLAVRLALERSGPGLVLLGVAAALLGWLAVLAISWRRIAALAAPPPPPVRRAVPLTAAATVGFAVIGIGLVLPAE